MAKKPTVRRGAQTRFVLTHKRAPGDTLVLTALVRDIAKAYPGKYMIDVDTSAMDLWRHNPHLSKLRGTKGRKPAKDVKFLKMEYGKGIRDQNHECVHFMPYFHRDFQQKTGIKVPVSLPYPDLHLSPDELKKPVIQGRYWVMLSGGKSDFTAKVWHKDKFQEVATRLNGMGLGVVQLGGNDKGHWHPEISGTIDLVGQTNLRDMMRIIHHSDGVICGVTCAMHMAAALQRPCVVLAGGREAWWWEAYTKENDGLVCPEKLTMPHSYLHTIGLLDCCKKHGCWKNKVVPIKKDKSLCYHPVMRPEQPVPLCMDMITADHVMESVMAYYENNKLPPINLDQQPIVEKTVEATVIAKNGEAKRASLLSLFDDDEETVDTPAKPASVTKVTTPAIIRPEARLETRGPNRSVEVARAPAQGGNKNTGVHAKLDENAYDHPDVGGKFTICALFYGPEKFYDLHARCLNSIISTVPANRMDLRVGSNALNKKSLKMINDYVAEGIITKHYQNKQNRLKYPVMRDMFFDPKHPIDTKWVLWFDDDSIADRTPAWSNLLAQHIVQYHRRNNAHMFGAPFVWTMKDEQRKWVKSRSWYNNKAFRLHNGKSSPSGNRINFCTGGFWAITHEAIVKCNIPDPEIGHNGGDIMIGEQLWQGGLGMKTWNAKKQFIHTSSVKRRGETKPMPGTAGHDAVVARLVQV